MGDPSRSATGGQSSRRIAALDGVRGIAILMVIPYHCVFFAPTRASSGLALIYERVVIRGYCGVDLFFVLSGFLITGILYDAKERTGFFRTFYARRVLRIFPAYYLALVLSFVVAPALFPTQLSAVPWGSQAYAWTYFTNVLFGEQGWNALPVYTGHYWSLAVEEQFYLVWPLLVFLLSRRRLIGVCAVAMVLALAARWWWVHNGNPLAAYVMTVARIDELAAGALVALVARGPQGLERAASMAWAGALAGGVAFAVVSWLPVAGLATRSARAVFLPVPTYVLCVAILLLAITTALGTARGRLFAAAPLRFFGKHSYGLYIVHQPLILALRATPLSPHRVVLWSGTALGADALFLAVALAASVAAAWLSWHLWEHPFLRLKDRVRYGS